MVQRRTVTLCTGTPRARKHGGSPKLWAYGYPTLADLFETSEGTVRTWVWDKRFNPADLASIIDFMRQMGKL